MRLVHGQAESKHKGQVITGALSEDRRCGGPCVCGAVWAGALRGDSGAPAVPMSAGGSAPSMPKLPAASALPLRTAAACAKAAISTRGVPARSVPHRSATESEDRGCCRLCVQHGLGERGVQRLWRRGDAGAASYRAPGTKELGGARPDIADFHWTICRTNASIAGKIGTATRDRGGLQNGGRVHPKSFSRHSAETVGNGCRDHAGKLW